MMVRIAKLQPGDKVGPGDGKPEWYTVTEIPYYMEKGRAVPVTGKTFLPLPVVVPVRFRDGGTAERVFDADTEVFVDRV